MANKMAKLKAVVAGLLFAASISTPVSAFAVGGDFQTWLGTQQTASIQKMLANVSPAGTKAGVVVASPQQTAPNYYFHWTRDAALTMNTVFKLYQRSQGTEQKRYFDDLVAYARFTRENQLTPSRSGLGEPKWNVDGSAFGYDWCRPQNDGPALRAMTLIHFANALLDQKNNTQFVTSELYDGKAPTQSTIKTDLEFVSHNWRNIGCDIWEEVYGEHFYTKVVQHTALIEGAALANRLGDTGAANFYSASAKEIEPSILAHWDQTKNIFMPTINWQGGINYKASQLDSQVILAVLHSGSFQFTDARIMSTMRAQIEAFGGLYSINRRSDIPGVGIGRYPEDVYDGGGFRGGNPWFLTTAGFANGYYHMAVELTKAGHVDQAKTAIQVGDAFLQRVQFHAKSDGGLDEQFNRDSGYMVSARDLTWSYSEMIEATWEREAALQTFRAAPRSATAVAAPIMPTSAPMATAF